MFFFFLRVDMFCVVRKCGALVYTKNRFLLHTQKNTRIHLKAKNKLPSFVVV